MADNILSSVVKSNKEFIKDCFTRDGPSQVICNQLFRDLDKYNISLDKFNAYCETIVFDYLNDDMNTILNKINNY